MSALFRKKPKAKLGTVIFETTEACNQNCRFCYNHWRPDGAAPADPRLAAKTLRRLLSQAETGSISFSGGEPTLLRNLHDMALRCRFSGSSVNILTNGTRLSEDDIRNFGSIGISAIQIPLLSTDPAIHDHLTCLPGSWAKARTSLLRSVEILGPEHVAAVLVISSANAHSVADTLAFYERIGVRTVMVNRFNMGGNGLGHRDELILDKEQLAGAFRAASDFAVGHPQMRLVSGVCTPMCLLDPADYPGITFTSCSTDLHSRPLAVNYRGDVRFCNHSPFVLGNIYERHIRDIVEDRELLDRYTSVPDKCLDCRLYARCKGGCRAASEQVYGSFSAVDPVLEIR